MMQRLVQLALDLFEPAVPQVRPEVSGAVDPEKKKPPALAGIAQDAPDSVAKSAPAVPLSSLLAPAEFRHPRARREVLLGDAVVAYAFERARRRSIGFSVGAEGLSVRAPQWVTLGAVDAALRDKSDWILRKLQEARERHQRLEGGRIQWMDGGVVPYLGHPLQLRLDAGLAHSRRGAALSVPHEEAEEGGDRPALLHLPLPRHATEAQIRDTVQAWLQRQAREHFTLRLQHFAPQLGVRWTSLRLSSAQTRWGSAKADGSIRLNWRLMHYRPAVIDYVVAHELAHLRVMDHSPRFWNTVATVVPDYATLRNHLRDEPAPLWE